MINALSQASALNPGSDLWICPDFDYSHWVTKLDWYLNFQITRTLRHSPPEISSFLKEAIAATELSVPQYKAPEDSPLLIHSESLLPNKWVLVLNYQNPFKAWFERSLEVWQHLQRPSLRVFLPTGQSASSLEEKWLTSHGLQEISIVPDYSM